LNFELFLYGSSNFFPRKLLKKVFGLPSAPLPPAIRRVELRPKTWNFSILLKRKNGARNPSAGGKKMWENFRFWSSENSERRKARLRVLTLFISLAVLDPDPPIRGRQEGTP